MSDLDDLAAAAQTGSTATEKQWEAMGVSEWILSHEGSNHGPYNMHELQTMRNAGTLSPDTPVCRAGMAEWVTLENILPGLLRPPEHLRYAKARGSSELRRGMNKDISWHAAVVIAAAIIVPLLIVIIITSGVDRSGIAILATVIFILTAVAVFAFRSGLSQFESASRRSAAVMQTFVGFGVMALGMGVIWICKLAGPITGIGHSFYIVPTGLYVGGMAIIGNALSRKT